MVNYNNGKIYKIIPKCEHEPHEIYVGSTTKTYLSQRYGKHVSEYKRFMVGKAYKTMSYELFNKYGEHNCDIILLETVNCTSKEELHARENYYIRTLNCLNKVVPLRTRNEYREQNKEHINMKQREGYTKNKDVRLEKSKKHYQENKELYSERAKLQFEKHKESNLKRAAEYRKQNNDIIKEKHKQYRDKKRNEKPKNVKLPRSEQQKLYYEQNKEIINAKRREKYQASKLKLSDNITTTASLE